MVAYVLDMLLHIWQVIQIAYFVIMSENFFSWSNYFSQFPLLCFNCEHIYSFPEFL